MRFSLRSLVMCLLATGIVAGAFLFVASDYARLQILRASGALHLQEELHNLKTRHTKVLSYKSSLQEKLNTLASVLETATSLGIETNKKQLAKTARDKQGEGLGGLEVDCTRSKSPDCPPLDREARARLNPAAFAVFGGAAADRPLSLDKQLDRYIRLIAKLPLSSPVSGGHIRSGYGYRDSPFGGGVKLHKGVDFALDDSGKVLAAGDGVIEEVSTTSTYGLMLDIEHQKHVLTRYAHLSKVFVKAGDKVKRGQVVAIGGSSGRSTGPHLHYEVRVRGRTKDPMNFLVLADKLNHVMASIEPEERLG